MSDLFLIAHKVRGHAAFDVATQMECPECQALGCNECDGKGHWWIIPTSGHRAYPYWSERINSLAIVTDKLRDMPDSWPDHYPTRATPSISQTILSIMAKPLAQVRIKRRV